MANLIQKTNRLARFVRECLSGGQCMYSAWFTAPYLKPYLWKRILMRLVFDPFCVVGFQQGRKQ